MAKTKQQKQDMLASYKDRIGQSTGVLVLSQTGLTPNNVSEFKKKLSAVDGSYSVVKNTIFKIALAESDLPEMETFDAGPNAVVFTSEDVASTAKIVAEFTKEFKNNVEVRGGILEGQALSAEQVKELSELPTKEQSIAMIAGLLEQNISGIAYVLQNNVQSIAIILDKAFGEEK